MINLAFIMLTGLHNKKRLPAFYTLIAGAMQDLTSLYRKKWFPAAALVAMVTWCLAESGNYGDFYIFICASNWLDGVTDIYSHKFLTYYNYYYSVLFALLLKPFYHLPYFWVKFCWLLLQTALYFHLFRLLVKSRLLNELEQKQRDFFITAVFLFSFRFLWANLHFSQITILILWCSIYGVYCIHQGKSLTGSFILALGINIKLMPLVLLPYLLYRGWFKAFFFTVFFWLFLLLVPGLYIGHEYNTDLLKCWYLKINPANAIHVYDVAERSFHSLTTLLTTLLIENPHDYYALDLKRNIADVSEETLRLAITCTRLLFAALTLLFLRSLPFKKSHYPWQTGIEVSYILLAAPLLFPHQQHYGFLFIVPAFACVLLTHLKFYKVLSKSRRILINTALIFSYLTANLKILLGEFNHYYEHYKILTYGALVLVPLLLLALKINLANASKRNPVDMTL